MPESDLGSNSEEAPREPEGATAATESTDERGNLPAARNGAGGMSAGEHLRQGTALAISGATGAATSAGQRVADGAVSISISVGQYSIKAGTTLGQASATVGRRVAELTGTALAATGRIAATTGQATRKFAWSAARSTRGLASSVGSSTSTVMSGDTPPEQRILEATTKGRSGKTAKKGKTGKSVPHTSRAPRPPLGLPTPGGREVGPRSGGTYQPPPPAGPLTAAKRRPWLVLVPIVLLAVAAVFLADSRTPVHTAQTRLSVGDQQVLIDQVPGTIAARIALASSYSRLVDAQGVVQPLSEATGQDSDAIASRLIGSPIPESPLFFVEATGSSEESAVELSNLAADSLKSYIAGLSVDNGDAARLLKEFEAAQARVEQLAIEAGQAEDAFSKSETTANRQVLAKARAALASAELQASELRSEYEKVNDFDETANTVLVVNPATSASNDADSFRNRLIFTAVVLGGLIGIALAWAAARFLPARFTRD